MKVEAITQSLGALSLDPRQGKTAGCLELPDELIGLINGYALDCLECLHSAKNNRELMHRFDQLTPEACLCIEGLYLAWCQFLDAKTLWTLIAKLPNLKSIEIPERLKSHVISAVCNFSGAHMVRAIELIMRIPGVPRVGEALPLEHIDRRIAAIQARVADEPDIQYERTRRVTIELQSQLIQLQFVQKLFSAKV